VLALLDCALPSRTLIGGLRAASGLELHSVPRVCFAGDNNATLLVWNAFDCLVSLFWAGLDFANLWDFFIGSVGMESDHGIRLEKT
jgi:hypothetical protein